MSTDTTSRRAPDARRDAAESGTAFPRRNYAPTGPQPGLRAGDRLRAKDDGGSSPGAERCRRKFLRIFPRGFRDRTYVAWEREYKWKAHQAWQASLNQRAYRALMRERKFAEIANEAIRIESRTNLIFSFEKMALRDAIKPAAGARAFAEGLYEFLHGPGDLPERFEAWCAVVAGLPRRQTRVLTWPIVTVFGFIAQPATHMFVKPMVTRVAAARYGFDFRYASRPSFSTYASALRFASTVRADVRDLKPRDMIDLQSFIWVQGSSEY